MELEIVCVFYLSLETGIPWDFPHHLSLVILLDFISICFAYKYLHDS